MFKILGSMYSSITYWQYIKILSYFFLMIHWLNLQLHVIHNDIFFFTLIIILVKKL